MNIYSNKVLSKVMGALLCLFFFCCSNSYMDKGKGHKEDELRSIELSQLFPTFNNKGHLIKYDTVIAKMYYYRDQVIYYTSYNFDSITPEEIYIEPVRRYQYFVLTKGNDSGLVYDKYKAEFKSGKRVPADSVLKWEWPIFMDNYRAFRVCDVKLISSNKNDRLGTLDEIYSAKGKKGIEDSSLSGTIMLYFSNKVISKDYSLSKELDSIKQMTLYKMHIVNNQREFKEYGITTDRFESDWELKEAPITNREEIMSYFDRDKKESQLNK